MENLAWLQPVLIAAAVVFVLDLIGNMISFSNRIVNALTTAFVFAVLFGALIHLGLVKMDVRTMEEVPAAATTESAPAPEPAPESIPTPETTPTPESTPAPTTTP